MSRTKWFIENSKVYMRGMNPTRRQWLRAYLRFMWFTRKDKS